MAQRSLMAAACMTVALPGLAQVMPASATTALSFDIPALPAADALRRLADRSLFQLIYSPALLQGLTSKAVRGTMTPREALARLLDGTGIEIVDLAANAATLRAAAPPPVPSGGAAMALPTQRPPDARPAATGPTQAPASNRTPEPAPPSQVIEVTATKRTQPLQTVPVAVSVIDARSLQASGALGFDDYAARVPNLSFAYAGPGRQAARMFQLRGIFGADTSALYIGDTAIPTSVDPRVLDIERIEVQRGPQGSLFGSRAMGGVVQLIPMLPRVGESLGSGHLGLALGAGGSRVAVADATINRPLGEDSAWRLSAYALDEGGFIGRQVDPDASTLIRQAGRPGAPNGDEWLHRRVNRDRTAGLNLSLYAIHDGTLSVLPRLLVQRTRSGGPPYVENSVSNLIKPRQFDVEESGRDTWALWSLEVRADLGIGQLVSVSSYFQRRTLDVEDSTPFIASRIGGPVLAAVSAPSITSSTSRDRRLTQEIRLVAPTDAALSYIAGVFFQRILSGTDMPAQSNFPAGSPVIGTQGIAVGDSFYELHATRQQSETGLFGELTWRLSPTLSLTAGGRWFDIQRQQTRRDGGVLFSKIARVVLDGYTGSHYETGFNPRLALSWQPSAERLIYASVSRGFRPGIVNDSKGACAALGKTGVPDAVDSDALWSHEVGTKQLLADGLVRLNAAVFDIDWRHRQTQVFDCGLGFAARANVGAARSRGLELEVQAQFTQGMLGSLALGYTDARITDAGGALATSPGDRLPNSPRLNAALSLDASRRIDDGGLVVDGYTAYARADLRYVGASVSAQKLTRPSYTLLDLRLGARRDTWDLSLTVRNLTDRRANLSDAPELSDALNLLAINRPRTVGVDLRVRY